MESRGKLKDGGDDLRAVSWVGGGVLREACPPASLPVIHRLEIRMPLSSRSGEGASHVRV